MGSTDGGAAGVFCSLVIPCYNEAGNLPGLVRGFAAALKVSDFELIIVDNGSADGSAAVLSELAPEFPFLRVVTVPVNLGYGHGITEGLKAARGLYAGWAHGDLQYDPAGIMAAAESLRPAGGEKLFLKGLRGPRPLVDTLFTAGMSLFESLLFGCVLRDITAQPTIFHRSLLGHWAGAPADFSLDLYAYALARKLGFAVVRVPMPLRGRAAGRSSWNSGLAARFGLAARTALNSLRLRISVGRGGR